MKNPSEIAKEFVEKGYSSECPVIDTHTHFGPGQGIYFPKVTAEQMIDTMGRCGVKYSISTPHMALVDTDRGNMQTAELVKNHPDRFKGYWGVNPNYPDRTERDLARFEDFDGFVGFKFLSDYHKVAITDGRYAPVLEYAQERKLPILMHTWGNSGLDGPALVEQVAKKYPDVRILMGHAGYGQWGKAIQVARDHPNVYLELTAAYSVRGAIEAMVEGAGSEKILFGTDLPWFDPHYGIGCVLFAKIAEQDRHNILHKNAETLFGI
jgi:predicted TIM-barrel fold metal-dependent hydrolase